MQQKRPLRESVSHPRKKVKEVAAEDTGEQNETDSEDDGPFLYRSDWKQRGENETLE